jgi:hypothetical protein
MACTFSLLCELSRVAVTEDSESRGKTQRAFPSSFGEIYQGRSNIKCPTHRPCHTLLFSALQLITDGEETPVLPSHFLGSQACLTCKSSLQIPSSPGFKASGLPLLLARFVLGSRVYQVQPFTVTSTKPLSKQGPILSSKRT